MINYKQAGFNTLSEMFDNMLTKQAEGDHVGFIKMSSMLTSKQKVAFIEHSKGHEVFAGAMKDLVTESCGDYRVGKDYADYIKMALAKGGYIVTGKPEGYDCCGDSWSYPEVYFTDGYLIEGHVSLFQKEVHLKAVDAKERVYNKSITYLDECDLIESIDHFKHDIEETFNTTETPEISMEASVDTKDAEQDADWAKGELEVFIVNDYYLYSSMVQPVLHNLAKKINKGIYNPELALKSWDAVAKEGLKKHNSDFKDSPLSMTVADRREVAKALQEHYEDELQSYVTDPTLQPNDVQSAKADEVEKLAEIDSSNEVGTLAEYLQVAPEEITTEDGENYSVNGKTETYKVSDTALDLAQEGYQNVMHDNKYIYWK